MILSSDGFRDMQKGIECLRVGEDGLDYMVKVPLIERAQDSQVRTCEGAMYDLRIWELREVNLEEAGELGTSYRKTPPSFVLDPTPAGWWFLHPGSHYQAVTYEMVNTPSFLRLKLEPRTTLIRSGVQLDCTSASPGYWGPLTVSIHNKGKRPFRLQRFAAIMGGYWEFLSAPLEPREQYRGVWQGGKSSTMGQAERAK